MDNDTPDLAATFAASDWPDEIIEVRFIEWRELEVFDTTMTVPVIEIHTATQTGEEEGDWCKEQVEQAVGPWLVEHSVMWVMTYPKHRSHKADGAA